MRYPKIQLLLGIKEAVFRMTHQYYITGVVPTFFKLY
jgi:hypothetical protein